MVDNFIVAAYLLFILCIGIYYRAKGENFKSYSSIQGNAQKNKLLLVATIFASSVGGGTTFGISEKVFTENIAYSCGLIFAIPIDILIAMYIVPKLVKHYGSQTTGDIMQHYYGTIGRIITGLMVIIVSIGFIAVQISVSGRIFQYILELDYLKGVILSYGIVTIYTTIGGFRAIIFTNLIQFFAMIIAIPTITIIGLYKIGITNFLAQIPVVKFNPIQSPDLLKGIIVSTLSFAVMQLYPTFIQRALINKNPLETRSAIYIKTLVYFIFLICITINGLIAYNLYPNQMPSLALPHLINQIIPPGAQGFVVIGLLAAVMSTADSDLNITSTTLVKDIIIPITKVNNEKMLLKIAKIINIVIGSLAIILAINFRHVVDLVIFITGFWCPIIMIPLIFALFGKTIPTKFMLISSSSGAGAFLLWEHYVHELNLTSVFVGTMTSIILFSIFIFVVKMISCRKCK